MVVEFAVLGHLVWFSQPLTLSNVVTLEDTMPPLSVLRLEYSDGASVCGSAGKFLSVLETRAPSVRSSFRVM